MKARVRAFSIISPQKFAAALHAGTHRWPPILLRAVSLHLDVARSSNLLLPYRKRREKRLLFLQSRRTLTLQGRGVDNMIFLLTPPRVWVLDASMRAYAREEMLLRRFATLVAS